MHTFKPAFVLAPCFFSCFLLFCSAYNTAYRCSCVVCYKCTHVERAHDTVLFCPPFVSFANAAARVPFYFVLLLFACSAYGRFKGIRKTIFRIDNCGNPSHVQTRPPAISGLIEFAFRVLYCVRWTRTETRAVQLVGLSSSRRTASGRQVHELCIWISGCCTTRCNSPLQSRECMYYPPLVGRQAHRICIFTPSCITER